MNRQLITASSKIEKNINEKIRELSSLRSYCGFLKRKALRYWFKKPDWISYVDRIFSWKTAILALGLQYYGARKSIHLLTRYYDRILLAHRLGFHVFEVPDQVLHAEVILYLYEREGIKRYKPLIKEAAELLESVAENNSGMVVYWPPDKAVLVDTLGMISFFCYKYDEVFRVNKLTDIARTLLDYTEQNCIDPLSGFPFHAYDITNGKTEGSSSWGRGIGWYLLGLTAYVEKFGRRNGRLKETIELVFSNQDERGFLYDDIRMPTHIDTSTTCFAAFCLAYSIEKGLICIDNTEKYQIWLSKAVSALVSSVTETGEVINCSGECNRPGSYSSSFGNYYAQGYTLLLLRMIAESKVLQRLLDTMQMGD